MQKKSSWIFNGVTSLYILGFILTLVSWLRICTEECGPTHEYHLFGFPFEFYGFLSFPALLICHLLSKKHEALATVENWMVALAVGLEINFILVQKYEIKTWCPVCLLIASTLFTVALLKILQSYLTSNDHVYQDKGRKYMSGIRKAATSISFAALGFVAALTGVAKEEPLMAIQKSIKDHIVLGNLESPVEVYLFTDWQCPACRALEPTIEAISSGIMEKARLAFVDTVVHTDTLNFVPYNLSFLLNEKVKYFKLRKILTQISTQTGSPTDAQVEAAIKKIGATYHQPQYSDIAAIVDANKQLLKDYDIDATPTMIIVNRSDKKSKKLSGSEINEKNVMDNINLLLKKS